MPSTGDILNIPQYKLIESKNMEIYYANSNHKKAEVAILISDKIDFKTKEKLLETKKNIS